MSKANGNVVKELNPQKEIITLTYKNRYKERWSITGGFFSSPYELLAEQAAQQVKAGEIEVFQVPMVTKPRHMIPGFDSDHAVIVNEPELAKNILLDGTVAEIHASAQSMAPRASIFRKDPDKPWVSHRHTVESIWSPKDALTFAELTQKYMFQMFDALEAVGTGEVDNLEAYISDATSGVIYELMFGVELPVEKRRELMDQFDAYINKTRFESFLPGFAAGIIPGKQKKKAFNKFLDDMIRQRNDEINEANQGRELNDYVYGKDLLSQLIKKYNENKDFQYDEGSPKAEAQGKRARKGAVVRNIDDVKWSIGDVRDELVAAFIAGEGTTSASLRWAAVLLGSNPRVRQKLQAELDGLVQSGNLDWSNPMSWRALEKAPYLSMVVDEVFRVGSPVGMTDRELTRDIIFEKGDQQILIPKGTFVLMSNVLLQNSKEWIAPEILQARIVEELGQMLQTGQITMEEYQDNINRLQSPSCFIPERFEKQYEEYQGYFDPFSRGPRFCLGQAPARVLVTTFIAMLVQNYDLRYAGSRNIAHGFKGATVPKMVDAPKGQETNIKVEYSQR
jgi:cytochrome P450